MKQNQEAPQEDEDSGLDNEADFSPSSDEEIEPFEPIQQDDDESSDQSYSDSAQKTEIPEP